VEQNTIIDELRKQAAGVAIASTRRATAAQSEKMAAAELLEAVVDAVRPALKAMGNRVLESWDEETETATPATFRGLCLLGKDSPQNHLDSKAIILSEHGDLLLARYITEGDNWKASFELMTSRQVVDLAPDELPSILEIIGRSLAAQARGASERRRLAFVTKADRIHAAAVLLRTA
jgi:hypothetical protein